MSRFADCNSNGVQDWSDIAAGSSPDCNLNGKPDECDLVFDPRITDVNHNLIPDDCEPGIGAAAAAQSSATGDPSLMLDIMNQWWNSFDYEGLKAWQIGYEIKIKFAELGFDLGATLQD